MDRHDRELLDKQMRRLTPPRNDGVIALMFAAMFLVGMALGGVLSAHESQPIQIASNGVGGSRFQTLQMSFAFPAVISVSP